MATDDVPSTGGGADTAEGGDDIEWGGAVMKESQGRHFEALGHWVAVVTGGPSQGSGGLGEVTVAFGQALGYR